MPHALFRRHLGLWALGGGLSILLGASPAWAHGVRLGDLVLDHPYVVASTTDGTVALLHMKALRNTGTQADRLLGGHSPAAAAVTLYQHTPDGQSGSVMRAATALPLPAGSELALRHGPQSAGHLMLQGLRQPLRVGDTLSITLRFEKAGEVTFDASVVRPRS